jgi:hypothetical protein
VEERIKTYLNEIAWDGARNVKFFLQTEANILRLITGDIELTVFQNLAKIGLVTAYYPVFYSFIMAVQN